MLQLKGHATHDLGWLFWGEVSLHLPKFVLNLSFVCLHLFLAS